MHHGGMGESLLHGIPSALQRDEGEPGRAHQAVERGSGEVVDVLDAELLERGPRAGGEALDIRDFDEQEAFVIQEAQTSRSAWTESSRCSSTALRITKP